MAIDEKVNKELIRNKLTHLIIGTTLAGLLTFGGAGFSMYSSYRVFTVPPSSKEEYVQVIKKENPGRIFGREIYALAEERLKQANYHGHSKSDYFGRALFGLFLSGIMLPRYVYGLFRLGIEKKKKLKTI